MPRLYYKTKSNRGKEYRCTRCGETIKPGERYIEWSRRFGRSGMTYRQHAEHGRPLPSQLSSRKTARIEDELVTFQLELTHLLDPEQQPEADVVVDLSGLVDEAIEQLEAIATVADEVADEYEEGVQNMPESLQYGPTGEAMTQVAEELREWAEAMREGPTSASTTVDLPDPAEHAGDMADCPTCKGKGEVPGPEGVGVRDCPRADCHNGQVPTELDAEAWRQAAQEAIDEAVQEIQDEAQGLTENMPEYSG